MFITFETDKNTKITIDATLVKDWDIESLVRYAADQLGTDYVDFRKIRKVKTQVTPIDWQPLKRQYRQEMLTLKRPARKYAIQR